MGDRTEGKNRDRQYRNDAIVFKQFLAQAGLLQEAEPIRSHDYQPNEKVTIERKLLTAFEVRMVDLLMRARRWSDEFVRYRLRTAWYKYRHS